MPPSNTHSRLTLCSHNGMPSERQLCGEEINGIAGQSQGRRAKREAHPYPSEEGMAGVAVDRSDLLGRLIYIFQWRAEVLTIRKDRVWFYAERISADNLS